MRRPRKAKRRLLDWEDWENGGERWGMDSTDFYRNCH